MGEVTRVTGGLAEGAEQDGDTLWRSTAYQFIEICRSGALFVMSGVGNVIGITWVR